MVATAKGLREQKADLVKQARNLLESRGDQFTAEDQANYDKMIGDALDLEKRATSIASLETLESSLGELSIEMNAAPGRKAIGSDGALLKLRSGRVGFRGGDIEYAEIPVGRRGEKSYRETFSKYLTGGRLSGEQFASLQSDNDTQAGYLVVPEQLAAGVLQDLDDLLWIRSLATIHQVREAGTLGITKRTAKAATFAWGGELTAPTEDTTLAVGRKNLTPHYATGLIKVSKDLIRRSMLGVEALVRSELALDAAELQEQAFMTGHGSGQPLGLFTASANGISTARDVSTGNSTTAIVADHLRTVKYSLKAGHRRNARWLLSRTAISAISKFRADGATGDYLWKQGIAEGDPDTLLGHAVMESEYVPATFTAGLYVGMFGDFRYYHIADALDIEMQRLEELYALTNQIGFVTRIKTDGMPVLEEAFVRMQLAAA